jgi:hypothetical protein
MVGNGQRGKAASRQRAAWLVEAGRGPVGEFADQVTWADLEADYNRRGNRSWERASRALTHLETMFGTVRAMEITANRICGYDDLRLSQGASPASRRYELAVLRRAFRVAVQRGKLQAVPAFPSITVNNARAVVSEGDLSAATAKLASAGHKIVIAPPENAEQEASANAS